MPPGDALAGNRHVAAIRLVQAGQTGEQGRFPAARRAYDRDNLASVDADRHSAQCEGLIVAGVEEAVQLARVQKRPRLGAHTHRKLSETMRHGSTLSEPTAEDRLSTAARPFLKNSKRSITSRYWRPVTAFGALFT